MKLTKLTIIGYKSIQDELDFFVRDNLTCLIGANEHGKSNLLKAIHCIGEQSLNETDKNNVLTSKNIPTITYDLVLSPEDKTVLLGSVNEVLGLIKDKIEQDKAALKAAEQDGEVASSEKETEISLKNVESFQSEIKGKGIVVIKLLINREGRIYFDEKRMNLSDQIYQNKISDAISLLLPKAYLFNPSNQIADSVSIDELNTRANIEFEGLIKLAGAWDKKEDLFKDGSAADGLRVKTSRFLTRKVRSLWSQGSSNYNLLLTLQSGPRLALTIEDKTGNFDSPSQRSLGFRAFFSFYLVIYAETYTIKPHGFVFLFDEPDVHLHPEAQKDLLKELRNLSKNNQVVFASHSPFMIDKNNPQSTIVVKKETKKTKSRGTRLIYKSNHNNWFPVRESLGVLMADTMLYTEKSLFVEGTSDRLYVDIILSYFVNAVGIDMNYLSILDGDKRSEMAGIAEILLSEGRKLTIMVDGDPGGEELSKQIVSVGKRIRKENSIEVLNLGKLTGSQKQVSIEDFLPSHDFCKALNDYLNKYFGKTIDDLENKLTAMEKDKTRGAAMLQVAIDEKIINRKEDISKVTVADFYCLNTYQNNKVVYSDEAKKLAEKLKNSLNLS